MCMPYRKLGFIRLPHCVELEEPTDRQRCEERAKKAKEDTHQGTL